MATAIDECQKLGGKEVCTEHVLLALLKERGSVSYNALKALGLSYDDARRDVKELAAAS